MNANSRLKYVLVLALTLLGVVLYFSRDDLVALWPNREARAAGFEQPFPPQSSLAEFDTQKLTVPGSEILSGGPGKDGIPSITNPEVTTPDKAGFLAPDGRVVGVLIGGTARAYPIAVLNWHEVLNDELGGTPIAVVYCPLCDSVTVVDRRVDGQTLEFGVSGMLHNSNVLLYDRTDNALWSQVGFEAISGPRSGQSLPHLPFDLTTFKDWSSRHPETTVVTFNTGHRRDYGTNPYQQYFSNDELMFPVKGSDDPRFARKERVVGIRLGEVQRAYPLSAIIKAPAGRLEDSIGGQRIVLESSGENEGVRVTELPSGAQVVHTFWFAWNAFHPDTTIYTLEPR